MCSDLAAAFRAISTASAGKTSSRCGTCAYCGCTASGASTWANASTTTARPASAYAAQTTKTVGGDRVPSRAAFGGAFRRTSARRASTTARARRLDGGSAEATATSATSSNGYARSTSTELIVGICPDGLGNRFQSASAQILTTLLKSSALLCAALATPANRVSARLRLGVRARIYGVDKVKRRSTARAGAVPAQARLLVAAAKAAAEHLLDVHRLPTRLGPQARVAVEGDGPVLGVGFIGVPPARAAAAVVAAAAPARPTAVKPEADHRLEEQLQAVRRLAGLLAGEALLPQGLPVSQLALPQLLVAALPQPQLAPQARDLPTGLSTAPPREALELRRLVVAFGRIRNTPRARLAAEGARSPRARAVPAPVAAVPRVALPDELAVGAPPVTTAPPRPKSSSLVGGLRPTGCRE